MADDERAPSPSSADNDKGSVHERSPAELFDQMVTGTGSVGGKLRKAGLAMFAGANVSKDDETASVIARQKGLHGAPQH